MMEHEKINNAITTVEEAKKTLAVHRETCVDFIRNILKEMETVNVKFEPDNSVNEELVDMLAEVSFPVCFHPSIDGRPTIGVIQNVKWDEDFETAIVSGLIIDGTINGLNPFSCYIESVDNPEDVLLFIERFGA